VPHRIYIYRNGVSDTRALTAVRDNAHLPLSSDQRGTYGFDIRTAVNAITTHGYYLFTWSAKLLRDRQHLSSKPNPDSGQSDA
jgi:hypothetical protein